VKHALVETPDGSQLVRADGTVPRAWDVEQPVLHLLARLFVRSETLDACRSPRVSCTATVLQPADGVRVPRELVVRQPLSNQRYFVAGTGDSRYGFMVPLPSALPEEVVIRFEWRFTDPRQAEAVRVSGEDAAAVDHVLRLRLRPTERGQVFSTDTPAWLDPFRFTNPGDRKPYAFLSKDSLPEDREDDVTLGWSATDDVLLIDEPLDVPGILLSDVWALAEHEKEQLHEVRHTVRFDPASSDTRAHRARARAEMPHKVLVQAVRAARDIPYGRGTDYDGSVAACERHPALLALCGWWNANAPDPLHRRARLCAINVRVCDDGEYWNAHHKTPNMPVDNPLPNDAAARIGDVVLIDFLQGQRAATFDEDGCHLWDVAGHPWQTVGVSEAEVRSGECDEGWYPLQGLAAFPDRFPAAWSWLTCESPSGHSSLARAQLDSPHCREKVVLGVPCWDGSCSCQDEVQSWIARKARNALYDLMHRLGFQDWQPRWVKERNRSNG